MATRAVPDVPETTRSSPVDQACDEYIARIIKQRLRLLISELVVGAGAIDDTMGWTRQILRLATQATHMLKIRADLGDVRNVRFYTQVCIVDDGDVDKSHRLAGCVIGRTVAHKRMRTEIANPRIILLLCPLEYDRNPSRMSSLNTLIDAEMEYLVGRDRKCSVGHTDLWDVSENSCVQAYGARAVAGRLAQKHLWTCLDDAG